MVNSEKVILIIRDGWGYREAHNENAIYEAGTPNTDYLMQNYPTTLLDAYGEAVGLPPGYQGNSEVGHMTIGSGRIIFQSLDRINTFIRDGRFFKVQEFLDAIANCKKNNTSLHIIGLLQIEGVHAHIDHLFALLDLCKKEDFKNVYIHIITDGRDAPVTASLKHIATLKNKIAELGFGTIATVSGRYYTMDRDRRWERTKVAYDCIVSGLGDTFEDITEQIQKCHASDETDEFIKPRKQINYSGIKPHDSIIFYNFRTDRPRQLTRAIVDQEFPGWERKPLDVCYVAMTQYYAPMNASVAFKDQSHSNLLGETISKNNLRQFRISETEKYAHVTFFFDCQQEQPFAKEDCLLIPSPKVATYDLDPEMSVYKIADELVKRINTEEYSLIVTNLVNGDMVGHTGIPEAIRKAVTAVDTAVKQIVDAGLQHKYTILIFADHGNCEDQTIEWRTSHTLNKVPCILVSEKYKNAKLKSGKGLQDIAPTVLDIMEIPKPEEMTGESLIEK